MEVRDPREQGSSRSARCGSSTPRAGTSCRSTPTTGSSASDSRRPPPAERTAVARELTGAGVAHLTLSTDRDWLRDLAVFLRRQRR